MTARVGGAAFRPAAEICRTPLIPWGGTETAADPDAAVIQRPPRPEPKVPRAGRPTWLCRGGSGAEGRSAPSVSEDGWFGGGGGGKPGEAGAGGPRARKTMRCGVRPRYAGAALPSTEGRPPPGASGIPPAGDRRRWTSRVSPVEGRICHRRRVCCLGTDIGAVRAAPIKPHHPPAEQRRAAKIADDRHPAEAAPTRRPALETRWRRRRGKGPAKPGRGAENAKKGEASPKRCAARVWFRFESEDERIHQIKEQPVISHTARFRFESEDEQIHQTEGRSVMPHTARFRFESEDGRIGADQEFAPPGDGETPAGRGAALSTAPLPHCLCVIVGVDPLIQRGGGSAAGTRRAPLGGGNGPA